MIEVCGGYRSDVGLFIVCHDRVGSWCMAGWSVIVVGIFSCVALRKISPENSHAEKLRVSFGSFCIFISTLPPFKQKEERKVTNTVLSLTRYLISSMILKCRYISVHASYRTALHPSGNTSLFVHATS